MRIICSYCRKPMGTKPPLADDSTTHGMCEPCLKHYRRQWTGLSLGEYLDDIAKPVTVVDPEGRTVAVNGLMAKLLDRPPEQLRGLLGGEAMECQYARLPGGCGRTVHCETCTIRRRVVQTLETGEPVTRAPAFLDKLDGRVELLISTELVQGGVVRVTVEPADPQRQR